MTFAVGLLGYRGEKRAADPRDLNTTTLLSCFAAIGDQTAQFFGLQITNFRNT
jgi:hypothetical protein